MHRNYIAYNHCKALKERLFYKDKFFLPRKKKLKIRTSFIGECGSTLYVGLTGIVQTLIQKSMRIFRRILRISKASDNTKAVMKKQIRRIHSVFSHVGP